MTINVNMGAVLSVCWVLGWVIVSMNLIGDEKTPRKPGDKHTWGEVVIVLVLLVVATIFGWMWGNNSLSK